MQFEWLDTPFREFKQPKALVDEPPVLELKQLPSHLKYAYLGDQETLPVIISAHLTHLQEDNLIMTLKRHKKVIGVASRKNNLFFKTLKPLSENFGIFFFF